MHALIRHPPAAGRFDDDHARSGRPAQADNRPAVLLAADRPAADVLADLGSSTDGLATSEAGARLARFGGNTVASMRAQPWTVLWHQLRSPLLGLLVAAAITSFFVGQRSEAVIIGVIVALSVGLGFVNEFRAEKAAQALHSRISHQAVVIRDGQPVRVPVVTLVPGDVVELRLGDLVPADLRLLTVCGLECDEAVLTGESMPVAKSPAPTAATSLADLTCCALMGTVVHAGEGRGVAVATGPRTEFGAMAADLATAPLHTEFQTGLARFSMLLVWVAGALTTFIFAVNLVLHRPLIDALLFSLAIAVGITPQLLPAVVSTSLAAGSRRLARKQVLVKRLVCIEDLGDVDVLLTDKTGTLTQGRIGYLRAIPVAGVSSGQVLRWGLVATETEVDAGGAVGGNALDEALWDSPAAAGVRDAVRRHSRLAVLPFDHERRLVSVLVRTPDDAVVLATKGAPEAVLDRCNAVPQSLRRALAAEFASGNRVVAVAVRSADDVGPLTVADERGLDLVGLLVFLDPVKPEAATALRALSDLGITTRILTGDNPAVALTVCRELGLPQGAALTGADLDMVDDPTLAARMMTTTVLARVSPEQKARVVRVLRESGHDVAFLGDGVNDALALHAADVGISVDSATDVAKDAADVILLDKDLGVVAVGVAVGLRIFANTIKYVLMGTSSNFGNMFSAAGASLFLPFLPMLPGQILLNNLLYDASQLAIPTDTVDEEQRRRPSHWDIGFIRRFMMVFGPISSAFDFGTFAIMLWLLHAGPAEFRSGWFVESLATQTLVIFAIRTRRVPWFRSHPSLPLASAAVGVVAVGAILPASPLARTLGFAPLPALFFGVLAGMVVCYLAIIEAAKAWFYRSAPRPEVRRSPHQRHRRHMRRRAGHFASTSAAVGRASRAVPQRPRTVGGARSAPGGRSAPGT
jgi:Mg2+-importing ATPase